MVGTVVLGALVVVLVGVLVVVLVPSDPNGAYGRHDHKHGHYFTNNALRTHPRTLTTLLVSMASRRAMIRLAS